MIIAHCHCDRNCRSVLQNKWGTEFWMTEVSWVFFSEKAAIQVNSSKCWMSLARLINACPERRLLSFVSFKIYFQIGIQLFLLSSRPHFSSRCYVLWIAVIYCSSPSTVWIADTFGHMSEVCVCQIHLDINGVELDIIRFFYCISNLNRGGGMGWRRGNSVLWHKGARMV